MKKTFLGTGIALTLLSACAPKQSQETLTKSGLNPTNYETIVDGVKPVKLYTLKNAAGMEVCVRCSVRYRREMDGVKPVKLYTLKNAAGMEVCVTNFGGRIVSIMVPDKNGNLKDVVLGFDSIADYQNIPSDFGASIGRYANRINKGVIVMDGETIQLPQNNFGHCLHGGPKGWQYQVYEANQLNDSTMTLTMKSPDGDANFPGNVTATVTYALTRDNAIDINYEATTDKKTVINMTNHSYFNLSGNPANPATDHILYVNADSITPVDSTFMTTGEMMAVTETPFDFNTPKTIAPDVTNFENEQIKFGNGFDHNWVLNTKGDINQLAAKLTNPTSGITLEVYTNEPGIQVYTGNFLDGTVKGKKGEPGQTYHSQCIFKFGVEK